MLQVSLFISTVQFIRKTFCTFHNGHLRDIILTASDDAFPSEDTKSVSCSRIHKNAMHMQWTPQSQIEP